MSDHGILPAGCLITKKTSEVWGDLELSQDEVSKIDAHVQCAHGPTSVQLMQFDLQENTE